jgi:hypothetical protein
VKTMPAPRQGERRYGLTVSPKTGDDESDEDDAVAFGDENPFARQEPDWFKPEPVTITPVSVTDSESYEEQPAKVETPTEVSLPPPNRSDTEALHQGGTGTARSRTVRINFRRSQSLEADRRRLNDLVELLSSFEGEDRFEITLLANGKARYQLEFPNNTTRVCRELTVVLTQRLGAGGWSVDESLSTAETNRLV